MTRTGATGTLFLGKMRGMPLLATVYSLLLVGNGAHTAVDLTIERGTWRRCFAIDATGQLRTQRFESGATTIGVVSREFRFVLSDGRELTPRDLPKAQLGPLPPELGTRGFTVRFSADGSPFTVVAAYISDSNSPSNSASVTSSIASSSSASDASGESPWMHKQLRLELTGVAGPAIELAEIRIAEIEVERLTLTGGNGIGWSNGGSGAITTSSSGLFAALEHPAGQCDASGSLLLLHHCPDSESTTVGEARVWPWSQRAVVGFDGGGAALARYRATLATPVAPRWIVDSRASGAASDSDSERFVTQASWAEAAGAPRPSLLWLDPTAFSSDHWFTPDLARFPAGLAPLAKTVREHGGRLAITVPLAKGDGSALPIATAEEKRTARKVLLACMQDEGQPRALGWITHQAPVTLPSDPAARERLVNRWLELFAVERKLAPSLVIALSGAPPAGEESAGSPFWHPAVDLLLGGDAPIVAVPRMVDGSVAAADRLLLALTTNHPLRAFAPEAPATTDSHDSSDRRERRAGSLARRFEEWLTARPLEAKDGPQLFCNRTPRPLHQKLPAEPSGWVRVYPWCEVVSRAGTAAPEVVLEPDELALFERAAKLADLGRVPATGRFLMRPAGDRDLLLAPGTTHAFEWLDLKEGAVRGTIQVGAGPLFATRTPREPFGATLAGVSKFDDGFQLDVALTTPTHAQETVELVLTIAGGPPDISTAVLPPSIALIDDPNPGSSTRADRRWRWRVPESEKSKTVLIRVHCSPVVETAVTLTARLLQEPVRVRAVSGPRAAGTLPPTDATPALATTIVLWDGPPPTTGDRIDRSGYPAGD